MARNDAGEVEMMLSRRAFTIGLGSVLLVPLASAAEVLSGRPRLTAGVLSDTHLRLSDAPDLLTRALGEFKRRGVDVVVMAGDVVEDGKIPEYEYFVRIWQSVFGGFPGKSGVPELVIAWGNHDYRSASKYARAKFDPDEEREFMVHRKDEVWRKLFGEPFPGEIYSRRIKGVFFVAAHWGSENEIGDYLKAHASEIGGASPFVYVQHPHPSGTVFGSVTNAVRTTAELSRYPNCFAISGHSHTTISDDAALWQGAFTSMAAGCLKNGVVRHGAGVAPFANGIVKNVKGYVQPMKPCSGGQSNQGSILSVYDNRIVVERLDFASGKALGDAWELPLPLERHPEGPFVLAARASGPQFPPEAKVSLQVVDAANSLGQPERQVRIKLPQARPTGKYGRAIWNRFEVLDADTGEVLKTADALQPGQSMSIKAGLKRSAECAFAWDDWPKDRTLKIRITAMNAAGVSGVPVIQDIRVGGW